MKDIGDLKAPGLDVYGSKNFKSSWSVVNKYVIAVVNEFFKKKKMYKPINSTLVTLIPKFVAAKSIKDYRLISCCTKIYKIISKIMTTRLNKVLNIIINLSQEAFCPWSAYT